MKNDWCRHFGYLYGVAVCKLSIRCACVMCNWRSGVGAVTDESPSPPGKLNVENDHSLSLYFGFSRLLFWFSESCFLIAFRSIFR